MSLLRWLFAFSRRGSEGRPPAWPPTPAVPRRHVGDFSELFDSGAELERVEDICHLAPLLCVADDAVARNAAARILDRLRKTPATDLPRLDEAFRGPSFKYNCGYSPWSGLSGDQLDRLAADPGRQLPLLMCASFHHNGFVRERAVTGLSRLGAGEVVGCLLLRANDWVSAVQVAASTGLLEYLQPGFASHLVANLPLVLRLRQAGRRDNTALVERILAVIEHAEDGRLLLAGVSSRDRAMA
jgi:hypothetical protein